MSREWSRSPRLALVAVMLALPACAPVPRPDVLADLARIRLSPAATEAKNFATDAFAHAERVRVQAEAAFAAGDLAGAQLLGERSVAAFAHAHGLARIARAAAGTTEAKASLLVAETELAAIDAEQARVAADADALELKLKVARDAEPIQPSGRASPEREQARLAAARALAMQARLLCGAARLLGSAPSSAPAAPLDEATAALTKLETELSAPAIATAPIDEATRARAACLAALTSVRRAREPVGQVPGVGDALLAELSATGKYAPMRDDRGVVVTLRNVFGSGATLTPAVSTTLTDLGKVAAAHANFPVEVVVHTDRPVSPLDDKAQTARAESVVSALRKGAGDGLRSVSVVAGNQAPVIDPHGPDKARNARVEIVFVTPHGF